MNNTTETQVMTYEEAKAYYEPIAVYVANIVSEVTPPEIEVRAEWNGADDILVAFGHFDGHHSSEADWELVEVNEYVVCTIPFGTYLDLGRSDF